MDPSRLDYHTTVGIKNDDAIPEYSGTHPKMPTVCFRQVELCFQMATTDDVPRFSETVNEFIINNYCC